MVDIMKIVDLQLNIDGVLIGGGETVDDVIQKIKSVINTEYDITYQILHEEEL